jgi:hypothetical protein
MRTPIEILNEVCEPYESFVLNDSELRKVWIDDIVTAMNIYADEALKESKSAIDQLIREADHRTFDMDELQKKHDALTAFVNERKHNNNKMKRFNEYKEEIAKKYGYESWSKIDWYHLDSMNVTKPNEPDAEDILLNEAVEMYVSEERAKYEENSVGWLGIIKDQKKQYDGLLEKYKALKSQPHGMSRRK